MRFEISSASSGLAGSSILAEATVEYATPATKAVAKTNFLIPLLSLCPVQISALDLFVVDIRVVRTNCEAASLAGGDALNRATTLNTILFVPGSRPDRFGKALASGADIVCIDLEDAVAPADKHDARRAATAALAEARDPIAIRVNSLASAEGLRDLLALKDLGKLPRWLLLPMTETAEHVRIARSVLETRDVIFVPLIESAASLRRAHKIAAAPGVAGMMFGGGDLSAQLGVELAWEPLVVARSEFILACAGLGIPTIDVPFLSLGDDAGLEQETIRSRALGFTAKAAIHPAQVEPIRRIFRPTEAEMAEARDAVAAFRAGGGRAIRHEGRMLELPVIRRYEAMLASRETLDA
jgi:citrate lyase beta subunit